MIVSKRLAILLALAAIPALLSRFPINLTWLYAPCLIYFIIVLTETIKVRRDLLQIPSKLVVERRCEDRFSLGAKNSVEISVTNTSDFKCSVVIRDEPPYQFKSERNVATLQMKPRETISFRYYVTPYSRGDYSFGDIYVRVALTEVKLRRFKKLFGEGDLFYHQFSIPAERPVKVYPNLLDIRKYDILIKKGRTMMSALHKSRAYGQGTEFESLREYLPDDDYRKIDWKATAHRRKLISRQYQAERSQNVVIVVDAGRTMSVRITELTKLDHAVNAAAMIAYVVASGDDNVGLFTFAERVNTFLLPRRGRAQAFTIMESLYNLPITNDESNYSDAFLYLKRRWRKRSLIVVFSDLLDPESSRQIITGLQTMARNHLCICVTISDSIITESAEAAPSEPRDLFVKAAAIEALHERQQAIKVLEKAGVIVVDAAPELLSTSVVSRYMEVKSTNRL